MGDLHNELERLVRELLADASSLKEVVRCAVARHGVTLSEADLDALVQSIDFTGGHGSVEALAEGPAPSITIGDADIEYALREVENSLDLKVQRAINKLLDRIPHRLLQHLYSTAPQTLNERRTIQRNFERRLHERWRDGLDRLEMLIMMAHEAGELFVQDRDGEANDEATPEEQHLFEVLEALHCRACRTAREVLCLLKAGYADGAFARWRSLHEVAVTAQFILEHGGDTPQRYLDHMAVERRRSALQYQKHCRTLGYQPFSTQELEEVEKAYKDAIAKYGVAFAEEYGWAAHALGKSRLYFTDIEANLKMSKWRPFFRLACQSVHAGSRGLFPVFVLPDGVEPMLIAGATNAGLADPGHCTAISLTLASGAFLTSHPNLDALVTCQCMLLLCDDIGEAFSKADDALARDVIATKASE